MSHTFGGAFGYNLDDYILQPELCVGQTDLTVSATISVVYKPEDIKANLQRLSNNIRKMSRVWTFTTRNECDIFQRQMDLRRAIMKHLEHTQISGKRMYMRDFIMIDWNGGDNRFEQMDIRDIRMRAFPSLRFDCLNPANLQNHTSASCVIQYLVKTLIGKPGFVRLTETELVQEFKEVTENTLDEGISTNHMIEWAAQFSRPVSIYAIDGFTNEIVCRHMTRMHHRVVLVFAIRDRHLHPITDQHIIETVSQNNSIKALSVKINQGASNRRMNVAKHSILENTTDCLQQWVDNQDDYESLTLVDGPDLYEIIYLIYQSTGKHVYDIGIHRSQVSTVCHPETGKIIALCRDYKERKQVCAQQLEDTHDYDSWEFRNQGWSTIASNLFSYEFGKLPTFSEVRYADLVQALQPNAIVQNLTKMHDAEYNQHELISLDHKRCYAHAITTNQYKYPVFGPFDDFVRNTHTTTDALRDAYGSGCEYIVAPYKIHGIHMPRTITSWELTIYLLENKIIKPTQISYIRKARMYLDAAIFQPFVERCKQWARICGKEKMDKSLLNTFIGTLNQKQTSSEYGYVTTDFDEVQALHTQLKKDDVKIETFTMPLPDSVERIYFVKAIYSKSISYYGAAWRQIVNKANLLIFEKMDKLKVSFPDLVLHAVKTDALYLENVTDDSTDRWWQAEDSYCPPLFDYSVVRPPLASFESLEFTPFTKITREELLTPVNGVLQGALVTGPGGAGKTELLCDYVRAAQQLKRETNSPLKIRVVTFTNTAANVIRARFRRKRIKHVQVSTIDSYNATLKRATQTTQSHSSPLSHLVVDEVSMVHKRHMGILVRAKEDGVQLAMFGDFNQCRPIETETTLCTLNEMRPNRHTGEPEMTSFRRRCRTPVVYDYPQSGGFRAALSNRHLEIPFDPRTGRYDPETLLVVNYFVQHRRLPPWLSTLTQDPNAKRNIVYTNKKRNQLCAAVRAYENVKPGDWIVADKITKWKHKKLCDMGISQSGFFQVERVIQERGQNGLSMKVKAIDANGNYTYPILAPKLWIPIHAVTAHKYQGQSIRESYNIHELEKMSFHEAYVAITRTTKWKWVHFDYTDKEFRVEPEFNAPLKLKELGEWVKVMNHRTDRETIITQEELEKNPNKYEEKQRIKPCGRSDIYRSRERLKGKIEEPARTQQHIRSDSLVVQERMSISDVVTEGRFVLRWTDCGVRKSRKMRYNQANKEEKLAAMKEIRTEALRSLYPSLFA